MHTYTHVHARFIHTYTHTYVVLARTLSHTHTHTHFYMWLGAVHATMSGKRFRAHSCYGQSGPAEEEETTAVKKEAPAKGAKPKAPTVKKEAPAKKTKREPKMEATQAEQDPREETGWPSVLCPEDGEVEKVWPTKYEEENLEKKAEQEEGPSHPEDLARAPWRVLKPKPKKVPKEEEPEDTDSDERSLAEANQNLSWKLVMALRFKFLHEKPTVAQLAVATREKVRDVFSAIKHSKLLSMER